MKVDLYTHFQVSSCLKINGIIVIVEEIAWRENLLQSGFAQQGTKRDAAWLPAQQSAMKTSPFTPFQTAWPAKMMGGAH